MPAELSLEQDEGCLGKHWNRFVQKRQSMNCDWERTSEMRNFETMMYAACILV
jgi:hypothetical protein